MDVNINALYRLAQKNDWSIPQLAKKMALDYSYLYRVLQRQRNPGRKFYSGIMLLCLQEGLLFEDYVNIKMAEIVSEHTNGDRLC